LSRFAQEPSAEAAPGILGSRKASDRITALQERVIVCTRCPRLARYIRDVADQKRRMYRDQEYWGRPLPSFGDPQAELLILGLAPAAHGGNRTGRMFTGDRSGDFLYRALYEAGFANQPFSRNRFDGLKLHNCYITAALRCAPPGNKPLPEELGNCRSYLEEEIRLLPSLRAVLALGRIAFDTYLRLAYSRSLGSPTALPLKSSLHYGHGSSYDLPGLPRLFASYHPSQQNTQTGKLTPTMMASVLSSIREFLNKKPVTTIPGSD
jgi:uracil-DNA glycosylase family 4